MAQHPRRFDAVLTYHWVVAGLSLALATLGYCAPTLTDSGQTVAVYDAQAKDISAISLDEGPSCTTLELADGVAKQWRLTSEAATGAATPPEKQVLTIRAAQEAQDALKALLPLRAQRALGQVDAAHLRSFELDAQDGPRLHILGRHQEAFVLRLGRSVYGSHEIYAQVPGEGVYVMAGTLLKAFERMGEALWDRRLLPFQASEVHRITVLRDGSTIHFERATTEPPSAADAWLASTGTQVTGKQVQAVLDALVALDGISPTAPMGTIKPWCVLALSDRHNRPIGEVRLTTDSNHEVAQSSHQPGVLLLAPSGLLALRHALQALAL